MTQNTSLSYRDAGVDIDAGDALVERIKPLAKKTLREGVLGGIGGWLLIRSITTPLHRAIGHFERISEGKLTDDIDIEGRDETGLLLCNLATMQASLKAMLDNINAASQAIDPADTPPAPAKSASAKGAKPATE